MGNCMFEGKIDRLLHGIMFICVLVARSKLINAGVCTQRNN